LRLSSSMDEHARRICSALVRGWAEFEKGSVTLLDLSRLAEQAANALDNASAPLPQQLATAASDLEYAYSRSEREDHPSLGLQILGPVMAGLDE
jgi:hypothetical protein